MVRDNPLFVQRTKDGFFNANKLINSTNKKLQKYKDNSSTKDFIKQLIYEGIEKPMISGPSGTWMHPKLFIDFAMWVSVEFKSIVIDYVLDGLIKGRHDAGDYYNEMCATIMKAYVETKGIKPPPMVYINEANMIKSMLGVNGLERNEMSEEMLNNITHLQKFNSLLISKGVGKDSRVRQLNLQVELMKF